MTAQHTPGPWVIVRENPERIELLGKGSAAGPLVASIPNAVRERDANARLIAAAPDLLAALKQLEREASRAGDNLSRKGQGATLLGVACLRARAAIAKAEGRS